MRPAIADKRHVEMRFLDYAQGAFHGGEDPILRIPEGTSAKKGQATNSSCTIESYSLVVRPRGRFVEL